LQAACADAVGAFFVFLHLLERQSKRISDICLGHIKHQAAHAQALSNIFINRVSSSPRHLSFPSHIDAPSPQYVSDYLATSDGLRLTKAFMQIPDPKLR
jgi:hypothetical protein